MPTASIHEIVHPRRLRNPEKNELIEGELHFSFGILKVKK